MSPDALDIANAGAVQLAQPAEMIEANTRVEPQARCDVFERD
jgi:hypothetical protein